MNSSRMQFVSLETILCLHYPHDTSTLSAPGTDRLDYCFLFLKKIILIQFLKITFHLQLLQSVDYILVLYNKYILEPILPPVVCAFPHPPSL